MILLFADAKTTKNAFFDYYSPLPLPSSPTHTLLRNDPNPLHVLRVNLTRVFIQFYQKLVFLQLARDGEATILNELLKNVPDQQRKRMLNTALEDDGGTPLHLAARHNHYEVCKLLIEYGSSKIVVPIYGVFLLYFPVVTVSCSFC